MESKREIGIITKEDAEQVLREIQKNIEYQPIVDVNELAFFEKVPFATRILKGSTDVANQSVNINSALRGASTSSSVSSGFQFGAIGLAALEFLLIPALYLASYITGKKVPFNLNNNFRWGYSAAVLGLAITAAVVPGAAPFIGITLAAMALITGAVLLGKALYERYQLGKGKKGIPAEIALAEEQMQETRNQAQELEASLNNETEDLTALFNQIDSLKKRYEEQKGKWQELKEKEAVIDKEIQQLGLLPMLDKGLGVSFAAIAVIGAVLSIFFPPVGLGILAAVSIASLGYVVGRLAGPYIVDGIKSLIKKMRSSEDNEQELEALITPTSEMEMQNDLESSEQLQRSSTGMMFNKMIGNPEKVESHMRQLTEMQEFSTEDAPVDRHADNLAEVHEVTERPTP